MQPTAPPAQTRLTTMLGGIAEAFGDRNFRLYSIASLVSWMSYFIQAVAVAWTAWELTHSTRWLALVALMDSVPNIALMPLGGVIADRYDRFRVLLISYGCATLQAAVLAAVAFSGHLTIGLLAGLAFAHGTIHAFSIPAQFGFLPRFIERGRLAAAISVASAYTQLGIFAGPAVAGWVILRFGAPAAFATNVAGYGVYFAFVACLSTPPGYRQPPGSGKAFVADLVDGVRAIAGHRGIMGLLVLMAFGDALSSATRQLAPAFAESALGAGVEGFSTLLACAGIGATLAALWLAQGGARRSTPGTITWAFLGFLAATALLMTTRGLAAAGLAMVGIGCFFEISRTGTVALLQIAVPDALRGRVMSTQFLLRSLAGSAGVAAVALVADDGGLRNPILAGVAMAFLVWCAVVRRRKAIAAAFAPAD